MSNELTEIEENAMNAFAMKIEEDVPWENVEALSGLTQDDIMRHTYEAMIKLREQE